MRFSPSNDLNNKVYLTRNGFVYTSSLSSNREELGLILVIPAAPVFVMFPISAHVSIDNLPSLTPRTKHFVLPWIALLFSLNTMVQHINWLPRSPTKFTTLSKAKVTNWQNLIHGIAPDSFLSTNLRTSRKSISQICVYNSSDKTPRHGEYCTR